MYSLRNENLFAGTMGIGKTLISLILCLTLYSKDGSINHLPPGYIQIAIPTKTIFMEWKDELDRAIPNSYQVVSSDKQLHNSKKPIWLYTMDFPRCQAKDDASKERLEGITDKPLVADLLATCFQPNLLIIDELDAIGRPNTKRHQTLLQVRQSAARVLGLTGTPAENPEDIHNFCQFVYQVLWPYTKLNEFKNIFIDTRELDTHYINGSKQTDANKRWLPYVKFEKLPAWAMLMQEYIHRASLDDPDIKPYLSVPAILDHYMELEPSIFTSTLYTQCVESHKSQIERAAKDESRTAEALNLCNLLLKTTNHPNHPTSKITVLEGLVEKHNKVLIFTDLVQSGHYVLDYLPDALHLNSRLSTTQREKVLTQFKTDPNQKALVAATRISARGLNLTMVDAVIFFCLGWSANNVNQAIRRAARPGNWLPHVDTYFLYHNHMIDEHQCKLVNKKASISRQMLEFSNSSESFGSTVQSALQRVAP